MMMTKLYVVERDLQRVKRLLDAEVMIDVLARLLILKGITTEEELKEETAKIKSSPEYDFDVNEAEEDIKVFNEMMRTGVTERLRLGGQLNQDGTLKDLKDI